MKGGHAYHFIGIVPFNGIVLLLDGLSDGPMVIGGVDADWHHSVVQPFFSGLAAVLGGQLEFTVLAVCHNQLQKYQHVACTPNSHSASS